MSASINLGSAISCRDFFLRTMWPVCFLIALIAPSKSWFLCLPCAFLLHILWMCLFFPHLSNFISEITLEWAIFIHFIPFCFPSPPLVVPSPVLSTLIFHSLYLQLTPLSFCPRSRSLHHLTPFIAHCLSQLFISLLLSLSVFCVSRTLMVTQIFWLLAVPWGWDAASALHLEVRYNLHTASYPASTSPHWRLRPFENQLKWVRGPGCWKQASIKTLLLNLSFYNLVYFSLFVLKILYRCLSEDK